MTDTTHKNCETVAPIFIVGLNKSGTSLLYALMAQHPDLSGLRSTLPPKGNGSATLYLQNFGLIEGQKVPGLPDKLRADGQAHLFAYPHVIEGYRLTERNIEPGDKEAVERAYQSSMVDSGRRLVEKSPPNLVRTRYLQALFPDATFIAIARNPFANIAANAKRHSKWGSVEDQAAHWANAYGIFLDDKARLSRCLVVRYEDLTTDPYKTLSTVFTFCCLDPIPTFPVSIQTGLNEIVDMLSDDERAMISAIVPEATIAGLGYKSSAKV